MQGVITYISDNFLDLADSMHQALISFIEIFNLDNKRKSSVFQASYEAESYKRGASN